MRPKSAATQLPSFSSANSLSVDALSTVPNLSYVEYHTVSLPTMPIDLAGVGFTVI